MRRAYWTRLVSIICLLSVVVFKFQNCAQTPGSEFSQSSDGEVRLVDGWVDANKLSFMSPTYLVQENVSNIEVRGNCPLTNMNGEENIVDWQVVRLSDGAVVNSGQSLCESGSFQLALNDIQFGACDTRYEVRAQSAATSLQEAETVIRAFCDTQI